MQLILDEIHGMQREWEKEGGDEWAAASTINSSKVLNVTVSCLSLLPAQAADRVIGNRFCSPRCNREMSGSEPR
jgi:hypothetical protein